MDLRARLRPSPLRAGLPGAVLVVAALTATAAAVAPARAQTSFQQRVEYRMEGRLDEGRGVLEGASRVRYRNESPDTLREIYFHLYLNAFRPNSAWARKDLEYGIRTFQDLGPDDHGYERILDASVAGIPVRAYYPHAPDSTIVGFRLPEALPPQGTLALDLVWEARPSTVPRRQGRAGRQYDFAQGYPRVVVYDDEGWRTHPLYRAGEFYGEFATYDVTLEVARDQVMGATGVPVAGDPGWEAASAPGTGTVDHQREWYGSSAGTPCVVRGGERICGRFPARRLQPEEPLGHLADGVPAGRKRVRWYAEEVHHFAWSTSPDYIYEQGEWEDVMIRVLYRPGDEESWGGGVAVSRTAVALRWLDAVFGDYPYPQVTNLHRLEGGGTEFPMLVMDGSASQSLILHEVGHIYAHGILANNEWYEGWLDEGMTSFQTAWFFEEAGAGAAQWEGSLRRVLDFDLRGLSEPVVLRGEDYAEQGVYGAMIYTKGSVILWMLREMLGDEIMVRILRTYYERYRFRHVDSDAFQGVVEEVAGRDMDWFFGPWLHTTGLVDYGLEDVRVTELPRRRDDGAAYAVQLRLVRHGDIPMPVPLRLEGLAQAMDTVVSGAARDEWITLHTTFRPTQVHLDPEGRILDWDPANNRRARGWLGGFRRAPARDWSLHLRSTWPLGSSRTAVPTAVAPQFWGNDVGGLTFGAEVSTNVMDVRTTTLRVGLPAVGLFGVARNSDVTDWGSAYLRHDRRNPGDRDGRVTRLETFLGEGRGFVRVGRSRDVRRLPLSGPRTTLDLSVTGSWIYEPDYLIEKSWTVERKYQGEVAAGWRRESGDGRLVTGAQVGLGMDTRNHRWARLSAHLLWQRPLPSGFGLEVQGFAGGAVARDPSERQSGWDGRFAPRERQFFLSSGDPWTGVAYHQFRSRGGGFDREGWNEGGGTLRGFDPRRPFPWIATVSSSLLGPSVQAFGYGARPMLSAGVGTAGRPQEGLVGVEAGTLLWSLSPGVQFGGVASRFKIRIDKPLLVSDPELAAQRRTGQLGYRIQVGFVTR